MGDLIDKPLAHVRQSPNGQWIEHFLDEHLVAVAQLAAEFSSAFGSADWARIAGLWHDLGKFREKFQQYIKTVSGYDAEAHIEGAQGRVGGKKHRRNARFIPKRLWL